jgi:hypothetical protein
MDVTDEMVEAACTMLAATKEYGWPGDFSDEAQKDNRDTMRLLLTAAFNVAPEPEVRVKPLEWDELGCAEGIDAWYAVYEYQGWNCRKYPRGKDSYKLAKRCASEDEARAATQADYAKDFLSFITSRAEIATYQMDERGPIEGDCPACVMSALEGLDNV